MQLSKLTKAVVLSIATLAAGYTVAESANDHRSDSVPARPNHASAMHEGMMEHMDHGEMCNHEKMADCCKRMHMKMCKEMMSNDSAAMPCHETAEDGQTS